jgi:uncharacterized membrane protein YbhN (UPF0104 family)
MPRLGSRFVLMVLLTVGVAVFATAGAAAQHQRASSRQFARFGATRTTVPRRVPQATGTGGAVASMDVHASQAGIEVLLSAALAAPRVSQTNSATSLAEPAFYNSPLRTELQDMFGEKFAEATGPILPLDNYPGDATALQVLGRHRAQAIAEPVRLGGGSALAVHPTP